MNGQFSVEEIKAIHSCTKKCCRSLLIREMQIKTPLRYHITPIRLANVTKEEDDKYWRICGRVGTLIQCGWSCELIQPFWRAIWIYVQRATEMCIPFDPGMLLVGLYPKRS